jgi:hypothetical protein
MVPLAVFYKVNLIPLLRLDERAVGNFGGVRVE